MSKGIITLFVIMIFIIEIITFGLVYGTSDNENKPENTSSDFESISENVAEYFEMSPGAFTENLGQLDNDNVRFYAQGGALWFTDDGVWFEISEEVNIDESADRIISGNFIDENPDVEYNSVVIKQTFIGANKIRPYGISHLDHKSNFFYGNDPLKWRTGVSHYREVYYENIYDGIDLRYYTNEKGLKYDFFVYPGADPGQIRIGYEGANGLKLDPLGNMIVETQIMNIFDSTPYIYQDYDDTRINIDGYFLLHDNLEYGFNIQEDYNRNEVLIIDPTVIFSTLLGGTDVDRAINIEVSPNGNIYISVIAKSLDFPTTPGAYERIFNNHYDLAFVVFNHNLSKILYSTYLGGNALDQCHEIGLDSQQNLYGAGDTSSTDFPTTSQANDTIYEGINEAIVFKFNWNLSELVFSTYLGGKEIDKCNGLAVDSNDFVNVVGVTNSVDFPVTPGAFNNTHNNASTFVVRISKDGSTILHSALLGGDNDDTGNDIAVDEQRNIYIVGITSSPDFPTTPGAYNRQYYREEDVFISKLNWNASELIYSTYVTAYEDDMGENIIVDSEGNAYVVGATKSGNFPTTGNAFDKKLNNMPTAACDIFVLKLNHNGSALLYSTYIGSGDNDYPHDIALDSHGNVLIIGAAGSQNYPTTSDAFDNIFYDYDGFYTKINSNGSALLYSTFIGGNDSDQVWGIFLDSFNNVFFVGATQSQDFPISPNAYQKNLTASTNAFVFKISVPAINITSLSLLKDNEPVNIVYSDKYQYTFRVNLTNSLSLYDIESVRLALDPQGSNIQLFWNHATGQFAKVNDPENHISLESSSRAYNNFFNKWTIDFNVTFNWSYPDQNFLDVHVFAANKTLKPAWYNSTGLYRVENDLTFTGSLVVKEESGRDVYEDELMPGNEILNWTGLIPVYEDTIDLYPDADEFDIRITDGDGNFWLDSPGSGEAFDIETVTSSTTNITGFTYRIGIAGIPPECDATNETFTIRIDGDYVSFSNPTPVSSTWHRTSDVNVGIDIIDTGGGLVDGGSVKWSKSTNNGSSWNGWHVVPGLESSVNLNAQNIIQFEDGDNNLIKWQATDTIGNGPEESEEFRVLVDTENVVFSNSKPSETQVLTTEDVEIGITISDTVSGVNASSIQYAISRNEGNSWGKWQSISNLNNDSLVNISINLRFLNGTGNRIKWQASDIAGNGPFESPAYIINVNTWNPKPKVTLVSPENRITVNETQIELKWELTDHDKENVSFELYLSKDFPPHIYRTDIFNDSYTVTGLTEGETYYWKVIPNRQGIIGTCVSGIWNFIIKERIYNVTIDGPLNVSIYPGNKKSIDLTITNFGNELDDISLNLEPGKLSMSFLNFDNSTITLDKSIFTNRTLTIDIPLDAKPGVHKITITASSLESGLQVKDTHSVTIEIKKLEIIDNIKQEPKEESDKTSLYLIILVLIIAIVCTVFFLFMRKKSKKEEKEIKPSEMDAEVQEEGPEPLISSEQSTEVPVDIETSMPEQSQVQPLPKAVAPMQPVVMPAPTPIPALPEPKAIEEPQPGIQTPKLPPGNTEDEPINKAMQKEPQPSIPESDQRSLKMNGDENNNDDSNPQEDTIVNQKEAVRQEGEQNLAINETKKEIDKEKSK